MKGLTDIPGILVGHASDFEAVTGCTAILIPGGAVAGCDVRGSATGTEEFELLRSRHMTGRIHGLVFAGGSAFGLEAVSGVRRFLEKKGIGYSTGFAKVPLVAGAILYDLGIGKSAVRPTREMGEQAAANATDGPVPEGSVGAGTGATVGKVFGRARAMKGGVGTATIALPGKHQGVLVSALAAVNALGDIVEEGHIVAGARVSTDRMDLAGSAEAFKSGVATAIGRRNTTLVAVATNARLDKAHAAKMAEMASMGMARAISPAWTLFDGDVVVALSAGNIQADVNALGVAAAEAVAQAIVRGVRQARGLGGVPGLATG